jgi:hypothetical protein
MNRTISIALAAFLATGLPCGPVAAAFAQTVPIETGIPAAPAAPIQGLGSSPEAPPAWRDGLDQIVSYEGLSLDVPLTAAFESDRLPVSLRAASPGRSEAVDTAFRPVPATRRPIQAVSPAPARGSERASAGGEFSSGRTLSESLQNFGESWNASGRTVHAATDDAASATGYDDFRKLLTAGSKSSVAADVSTPLLAAPEETPAERKAAAVEAPKVKIPLAASLRYHASYIGSFAAAAAGAVALALPFTHMGASAAVFPILLLTQIFRQQKHDIEFQAKGAKEVYTRAEMEALLADPKNAAHAPALRNAMDGLDGAEQLAEYVRKRSGAAAAPALGWFRPVPYNLSSWGLSPETGWVALGETVLTTYLKKDWKIVAGAIAHEMGHIHFGDWRKYIQLEKTTQVLYSWAGASGAVRGMTGQRLLTGDVPLKDRLSIGALGALVLAAAKAFGLMGGSWLWLLAFPAAWGLMLLSALLKQAYMRAQEYRADQFSASATHKSWMIGYLMELRNIHVGDGSTWWQRIVSSHPSTDSRIHRLDPAFKIPERSAPASAPAPRYAAASAKLDQLRSQYEAARTELETKLGADAEKVEVVYDVEGDVFAFSVTPKKPGLKLPAEHHDLPVVEAGRLDGAIPSELHFLQFAEKLESTRALLEKQLVPDVATSVQAVHDGEGFLLAVTVKDSSPEALAKLPNFAGDFPVRPFKGK